MEAGDSADTLIDEIDEGVVYPSTHSAVRAIFRRLTELDSLQRRALTAFDEITDPQVHSALEREIWSQINSLPEGREPSGLRLAVTLLLKDEPVDWHYAGYIIHWSRQQGLSDQQIIRAFRETLFSG